MKVVVVTPYHSEGPETLGRCIESVLAQTVPCHHYLVADGPGYQWLRNEGLRRHVILGEAHRDWGNTPRGIGAILAVVEGADCVLFLDADNAYDPDHVATCLAVAADQDYVVAQRRIALLDGTIVACEDEPIEQHVDTNCFCFLPGSFHTLSRWTALTQREPAELRNMGDRVFLALLRKEGLKFAVTTKPTVTYVSGWQCHYEAAGVPAPSNAKKSIDSGKIVAWWKQLPSLEKTHIRTRLGLPHLDF